MRLHNMRRCLIAILVALAVAFAAAGCGPPHIKVPRPHVPDQVHEFNDTWKNINKHKKVEKVQHICYDNQGLPVSDDC
jgi:hypothetical protein